MNLQGTAGRFLKVLAAGAFLLVAGCLQGGPSGSAGVSTPSDTASHSAAPPALPTGIAAPSGEHIGDDETVVFRTVSATFIKKRTALGGPEGSLSGQLSCRENADGDLKPCLAGRVLRIRNVTKGFIVETALRADAGGAVVFRTPDLGLPRYTPAVIGPSEDPYDSASDWAWYVSPDGYESSALDAVIPDAPELSASSPMAAMEEGQWGQALGTLNVIATEGNGDEAEVRLPAGSSGHTTPSLQPIPLFPMLKK